MVAAGYDKRWWMDVGASLYDSIRFDSIPWCSDIGGVLPVLRMYHGARAGPPPPPPTDRTFETPVLRWYQQTANLSASSTVSTFGNLKV